MHFFGYCFLSKGIPKWLKNKRFKLYHPRITGLAPHCLHAYGLSQKAVKKLLQTQTIDKCSSSTLDKQIATLCNTGELSYSFNSTKAYDNSFLKNIFSVRGVHWLDDTLYGLNRDGLFAQVVFDEEINTSLPDGTAAHDLGRPGSIFILQNKSWRYIPSLELYTKILGDDPAGKYAVKVFTTWQFNHYKEGMLYVVLIR